MEELKNRLKKSFYCVSVHTTTTAQGTKVYCDLHVERNTQAKSYYLQICGENPMTGLDISQNPNARRLVSHVDNKVEFQFLQAYGTYELRCMARLATGEEVVLHSIPVKLEHAASKPRLTLMKKAVLSNGFIMIELSSNCWRYFKNKECLRCDGVTYPLVWDDDDNPDKRRFYVLGKQIELVSS